MSRRTTKEGFTVLELVVVLTVIMAVVSFIYPRMAKLRHTTYTDAASNTLKNLVQSQELLFSTENRYATDITDASLNLKPDNKVTVSITEITPRQSWLATAQYISWPSATCAVAMGREEDIQALNYTASKVECPKDF